MKPLGIAVIGAGLLLAVCGARNIDPRGVVFAVLTGEPLPAPGSGIGSFTSPTGRAKPYAEPGTGFKGIGGWVGNTGAVITQAVGEATD